MNNKEERRKEMINQVQNQRAVYRHLSRLSMTTSAGLTARHEDLLEIPAGVRAVCVVMSEQPAAPSISGGADGLEYVVADGHSFGVSMLCVPLSGETPPVSDQAPGAAQSEGAESPGLSALCRRHGASPQGARLFPLDIEMLSPRSSDACGESACRL